MTEFWESYISKLPMRYLCFFVFVQKMPRVHYERAYIFIIHKKEMQTRK